MQPHRHRSGRVDVAVDEGEVPDAVEWCRMGYHPELADRARRSELADALDQVLALLPPGDQVGDRDAGRCSAKVSICSPFITVPSSLASSQIAPTSGSPASVQRSTAASVARPHQHPAFARNQREHVPDRCSAEMTVVSPCTTSTETVKAVPSGGPFVATIGARLAPAP
jgi:hypothetical protein